MYPGLVRTGPSSTTPPRNVVPQLLNSRIAAELIRWVPQGAVAAGLISLPDLVRVLSAAPDSVGILTGLLVLAQYALVGGVLGMLVALSEVAISFAPKEHRNWWRSGAAAIAAAAALAIVAPAVFSGARISQTIVGRLGPFLAPPIAGLGVFAALRAGVALKNGSQSRPRLRVILIIGGVLIALVLAELQQLQLCRFRSEIGITLGLTAWALLQYTLILARDWNVSLSQLFRVSAFMLVVMASAFVLTIVPSNPTLVALARAPVASDLFVPLFVRTPGVAYGIGDARIDRMFEKVPAYGVLPAGYEPPARNAHLLFVVMDTLRADRWNPQYPLELPGLREVRERCFTFPVAFAPGAGTRDTVSAVLKGRTGMHAGPSITLDMFAGAGYRLGAVAPARALEVVGEVTPLDSIHDRITLSKAEATGSAVSERALRWMGEHSSGDQPLALWVHFFSAHEWAQRPTGSMVERYDRGVVDDDSGLQNVLRGLRELGIEDETIVVVFGDHGEGLDDSGWHTHKYWLYRSIVRVPLAFCIPGMKPREVTTPVSTVSIGATLRDLFGFDAQFPSEGASLLPLMLPGAPAKRSAPRPILMAAERQLGVVFEDRFVRYTRASRAVESMELHGFLDGQETNVVSMEPERTGELLRWIGVESPQ